LRRVFVFHPGRPLFIRLIRLNKQFSDNIHAFADDNHIDERSYLG
jgi:hypothetical protein